MWSNSQFLTESGYSTQAPSISSHDPYMLNEPIDSTLNQIDQTSSAASITSSMPATVIPPTATSAAVAPAQQAEVQPDESDDNNAVVRWMNSRDNSEKAFEAIPELLKLVQDDDSVVVQEASILFKQMSMIPGSRLALIQTPNIVEILGRALVSTTDATTHRSLASAIFNISDQPEGVQVISKSTDSLLFIVNVLTLPVDHIFSFSISTIHNVLSTCDDATKAKIRKMGAIQYLAPLLKRTTKHKELTIIVDSILMLTFQYPEAKQIILEADGTPMLVNILMNHTYPKLIAFTTRLIQILSACSKNKQVLGNCNAIQALALHLNPASKPEQLRSCLTAIRNLSDLIVRVNGFEDLVTTMLNLLISSNDVTTSVLAAGILANLACVNENNKRTALRSNAIQILLQTIQKSIYIPNGQQLIEPCVCVLRSITNKTFSDTLMAHEQFRQINGFIVVSQLLDMQPCSWQINKAVAGLIRNLSMVQTNYNHIRATQIIVKLTRTFYQCVQLIYERTNKGLIQTQVIKLDDVNLFEVVEICSQALSNFAKDYHNQNVFLEQDCIDFFAEIFCSNLVLLQKAGAGLLADLATRKECAHVIEQKGLVQFIQANYYNQFGVLKTITELTGGSAEKANSNAATILQSVGSLMQRVQEHKQALFQQQQQQQQQMQPAARPQYPQQQQQQQADQFAMQQMYYNSQMSYNQQFF